MSKFEHISHYSKQAVDHIRGRMDGTILSVPTPWRRYNEVGVDGLEFHSIVLLAAMSGGGKTLAANQICAESFDRAPNLDHMVLDFNFEMIGRNLVMRNISANMNMNMRHINSVANDKLAEEEFREICNYLATVLNKKPIYIVDEPQSVNAVGEITRDFYRKFKKKFIASFDHSILTKRIANETSQLDMLQNLGQMCTETKKEIPVIWLLLSQLNREIEGVERTKKCTSGNYPMKADIYGGDALYQHADMVTIIHRPALLGIYHYGPEKIICTKDSLFFHNLKVRNGVPDILQMQADFGNMRIFDPEEIATVA